MPTAANSAAWNERHPLEHGERRVADGDAAPSVSGLASRLVNLVADGDEPTVEVQALLRAVDVGPFLTEDLAAAHSGHGGEPEDREVPVAAGGAQQLTQFLFGQRDAPDPLEPTLMG
jgi:hypothetical protein